MKKRRLLALTWMPPGSGSGPVRLMVWFHAQLIDIPITSHSSREDRARQGGRSSFWYSSSVLGKGVAGLDIVFRSCFHELGVKFSLRLLRPISEVRAEKTKSSQSLRVVTQTTQS